MRKLMLGLGVALAVSIGALTAEAITSNKAVAVTLNEFNSIPSVQPARALQERPVRGLLRPLSGAPNVLL